MSQTTPPPLTPCPWPVEDLLAHAHPKILIERVLGYGPDRATAEIIVWDDYPMIERGRGLPSWALIEPMAQTIAALAGIRARLRNEPIRVGFLLGCRRLELSEAYLRPGAHVLAHATETLTNDNMGVFDCECVRPDGRVLAKGRLNVYAPGDLSVARHKAAAP